MVDLDLYATFVDIARYRSLSEAAEKLHISQPALSARLGELERALGVKLFFRSNRGIALTGEGAALHEHLKRGFSQIEAGENLLREIAGLGSGLLRIGASDMTLRFFLLDLLERFHNEHPLVRLSVTNAPTPQTLNALREGLIDFGVISEPIRAEDCRELTLTPVKTIRDVFVCSDKYSNLLGREVEPSELLRAPLVLLESETSTRRYIDGYFEAECGEAPSPSIELATSDLLLEFARRGIGVTCIVEDFALADLRSGRLRRIELTRKPPERRFLLAYLRREVMSAAARSIVESIAGRGISE